MCADKKGTPVRVVSGFGVAECSYEFVPGSSVLPVTEVRFPDLMDPEVEQFKTGDKKPNSPTIDVNVRPMNMFETHAIAIVVKMTRVEGIWLLQLFVILT